MTSEAQVSYVSKNKQKSFKLGSFETKIYQVLNTKKYLKSGVAMLLFIDKTLVTHLVYKSHSSINKPNKRGHSTHQDQRTFCLVDKFLFRQIQHRTTAKKFYR